MGSGSSKEENEEEEKQAEDAREPKFHKSLSAFTSVPTLYMRQELPENIAACCTGNTYTLEDHKGLLQFRAEEDSLCNTCCGRWWCGNARGFTMRVTDSDTEDLILTAERAACRCDWWCCFDCFLCANRIIVRDSENDFVGRVIQKLSCCDPLFSVENEVEDVVATVRGPTCPCKCCCDQIFNVFIPGPTTEEEEEEEEEMKLNGNFVKRWGPGMVVETQPKAAGEELEEEEKKKGRYYNMDHEHTQIIFPDNADDNNKALVLGAFFLVNYMYFEMS